MAKRKNRKRDRICKECGEPSYGFRCKRCINANKFVGKHSRIEKELKRKRYYEKV